eukprot:TRINITY_DN45388_c0_g1_i1.p1 TRINITY_DN45388_c0_g1~~TRINITY_DN45388_c0_g1_i1.p1  ORF type:complete len:976 (+),score=125.37 TRINITY_DN45388_c0_g1_i1:49-2976(+)
MKIDRDLIDDPLLYDILYFSPIEVGEERHTNQLYFQTDRYNRTWPVSMMEKMSAQIDHLRHVELNIRPFDAHFKKRHRDAVLFHCKMALAYLDAREARIAMKLCEVVEPATTSTENQILLDPASDFDFLRVTALSVKACAARRVKFYQVAVEALSEAKDICLAERDHSKVNPLMKALTLMNLSAVLGDVDHDQHGLRWGLEALSLLFNMFSDTTLPEIVQAYLLAQACHNVALLNVKLGKWEDAVELVEEGIEFTKILGESDDGLRKKLIAIGAQAKHVPEEFYAEAVNAKNGWGEERGVWNLSFWDFSKGEILEEIRVLERTTTLQQIIIDHQDEENRHHGEEVDAHLARLIIAMVSCQSLETLSISGIDLDPRKVWRRIKKKSFLETSWYASALNFTNILDSAQKPDIAMYKGLLMNLNRFSKKLLMFLVVLGNECDGVDLSENGIDRRSITALVQALRWPHRPPTSRQVATVILRQNSLDADTAKELAKTWHPKDESEIQEQGSQALNFCLADDDDDPLFLPLDNVEASVDTPKNVTSLDVSANVGIGDDGFGWLTAGIGCFEDFAVLKADDIGLGPLGCSAVGNLASTRLELLHLSKNNVGSEGAAVLCEAVLRCVHLHTFGLSSNNLDASAAGSLADLLRKHQTLKKLYLNSNDIGSDGCVELCAGAGESSCLAVIHLAYNNITTIEAAEAVGEMMRRCQTLIELNLSGNKIDPVGAPFIGNAIEHSRILTMYLEDMGFNEGTIDDFLDHGAAETQDLQVMNLNGNPVGDEGLGIIAECLSIGLTDLSLSSCGLTYDSQATLLNLVSLSPNLQSLDLSNNELGPSGCADMVQWMAQNEKDNYSLRSLELANCDLGDEGFLQLVPVLGALTYLGVRSNNITSAGLEAVMNMSHMMIQLRSLDLADNKIGESGVHALTERFQQEHKRSLWNPKQLTSTIDQVILSNNLISNGLAMSTEAFLKIHNPLLTVVW